MINPGLTQPETNSQSDNFFLKIFLSKQYSFDSLRKNV
jgi:hypothetical protein